MIIRYSIETFNASVSSNSRENKAHDVKKKHILSHDDCQRYVASASWRKTNLKLHKNNLLRISNTTVRSSRR